MRQRPASARASRKSARFVGLSVRGIVVLGAGALTLAVAYMADWPELLIISMFCGGATAFSFIFVFVRRPHLLISRFYSPGVATVASTGQMNIRVVNRGPKPLLGAYWFDLLPWGSGATPPREFGPLAPREIRTVQYSFVPPRRGIASLGRLIIKIDDPFRLVRGEFAVGEGSQVVVAPQVFDLDQSDLDVAADTGSARLFQHRSLAGEHDIMTRDYRPGDALRKVHWKATAHHGELMVREEDKRSHAEALIVLDTRRSSYADALRTMSNDRPESERFEWALELTSSLRDHLTRRGQRVNVLETALPQLADAGHLDAFISSLARIRLSIQGAIRPSLAASNSRGTGSVFAILDNPDDEIVDALTEQTGNYSLAVAFLLGYSENRSSTDKLANRLAKAGWSICLVPDGQKVPEAWARAAQAVAAGTLESAGVGSD